MAAGLQITEGESAMRCPECRAINQPDSTACISCGLMLFKLQQPRRRAEDRAAAGRRAQDRNRIDCPSCTQSVAADAIRCPHCAHVVSSDYRRQVIDRRRAQINYASWVAYLGGLLLVILFKPAGLALISIGLVLSVLYYAIPAHVPDEEFERADASAGWLQRLLRQARLERVFLPLPHLKKARLVLVGTPILAVFVGYLANFLILQRPMNDILRGNETFRGMSVSTHYKWWLVPAEVVYDLRAPGDGLGPLHVQAALLEFARTRLGGNEDRVLLRWRGDTRFSIRGEDFREIGRRYADGDFEYALLTLPRMVVPIDQSSPIPASDSREALEEFHRIWYGESIGETSALPPRTRDHSKPSPSS